MKNKKKILIALSFVIAVILILILCSSCKHNDTPINPSVSGDNIKVNTYVEEFETEKYAGRILEAETKEYITLFVETKLFEGKEKVDITYDSEKYMLDRANPLVENILPEPLEGYENKKYFKIELEPITNYSVDFIKKNPKSVPNAEDIDVK
jgi:hypothetical protein